MENLSIQLDAIQAVSAAAATSRLENAIDIALNKVLKSTGVESDELFLWDQHSQEMFLVAHQGLFPEAFHQRTHFAPGEGFPGLVKAHGQPILTQNLRDDARYLRTQVKDLNFRFYLCIPLLSPRGVQGCLNIASRHLQHAYIQQFLSIIAHQLSLAVDRAELDTRNLLTPTPESLTPLLSLILEKGLELGHTMAGAIVVFDEEGETKSCLTKRGYEEAFTSLRREGAPLLCSALGFPSPRCCNLPLRERGQIICLPISSQGQRMGVLSLALPRLPSPTTLFLLENMVSQASLALQWALFIQGSEEKAVARERKRLAREIHDGLAHSLALIGQKAELINKLAQRHPEQLNQELKELKEFVRESVEEAQREVLALRPASLDKGFFAAVRELVDRWRCHPTLQIFLKVEGEEKLLPLPLTTPLFRCLQEALHNVVQHARAQKAWIELILNTAEVSLMVRDDGAGFDPITLTSPPPTLGRLGLLQMEERVQALGGTFSMESTPGDGTTLRLFLPYG